MQKYIFLRYLQKAVNLLDTANCKMFLLRFLYCRYYVNTDSTIQKTYVITYPTDLLFFCTAVGYSGINK